MRELELVACQPRPYRTTTVADPTAAATDHLGRDFTAGGPGSKLVGIPLREWGRFLPEQTTAVSLLTSGESFRMREARAKAGPPRPNH